MKYSKEEIEKMKQEAQTFAQNDIKNKELIIDNILIDV